MSPMIFSAFGNHFEVPNPDFEQKTSVSGGRSYKGSCNAKREIH